uniref:(northern house mosquito) hypothetical protein n=1 Tax=Culex pipiens TaxID=7175 RepID=A0A8D8CDZ2_CULPI
MGVNCTQVHCVTHHRLVVVVVGPRPTESSESFDPTRPDQKRANGGHCCITTSSSSREDIDFHTLQICWRVAPRSGRNTNLARIFGLVEPLRNGKAVSRGLRVCHCAGPCRGVATVERWSGSSPEAAGIRVCERGTMSQ